MADAERGGIKNIYNGFMKKYSWLVLATMVATAAVAQNTNTLVSMPAPVLNPPAAPTVTAAPTTNAVKKAVKAKKKAAAKPAAKPAVKVAEPSAPLVAGPATVAVNDLNMRGQAGLKGEVVGHAKKGDAVTVISEINLDKPAAGEPSKWAKIALPSGTKVWVNSHFIDETNKTVVAKKLNLRGGPGENYSVLGELEKGTTITEIISKGDWTQIEAPASAFAFVAAEYLKQDASMLVPTNPAPPAMAVVEPAPSPMPTTTSTVPEPQPIVAQPPVVVPPPTLENVPAPVPQVIIQTNIIETNIVVMADTNLPPPPPRVVTHEGYVRYSVSVAVPTYFELYNLENNTAINYLYSTTTNLNLIRYDGLKVEVTGEEGLDARWKDTPVLTIQKIYVLPSDPMPAVHNATSPRARQGH